jgi:ATP synthase I chain
MRTDIDYGLSTRRLFRITIAIVVGGILVAGAMRGLPGALGFALGGGISLTSLWLWHRVTMKLGPAPEPKKSGPSTLFLVARFLALFACGYVIVKTLDVNVMAAICGLFASAAAVVAEVVFELITFRHSRSS